MLMRSLAVQWMCLSQMVWDCEGSNHSGGTGLPDSAACVSTDSIVNGRIALDCMSRPTRPRKPLPMTLAEFFGTCELAYERGINTANLLQRMFDNG